MDGNVSTTTATPNPEDASLCDLLEPHQCSAIIGVREAAAAFSLVGW